jgi:FkbM family methyltransferase
MPEGVKTKHNETQKHEQQRFAAPLRSLVTALFLPLKWLFRMVNRRQRQVLARIPGVLAAYRSVSPLLLSAGSEDGIPCAEVNGLKLYMDPEENASRAATFLWGQYEPATTTVVMEVVTDGDTIVDVGAHWGYFTLLAASLCGERGRVFAFEPHPRNFSLLTKNVEANGLTNVVPVQKAISNRAGRAKLFLARITAGHSLDSLPPEESSGGSAAKEAIGVDTVALDDFFARSSVEPRLVKMDIEGAEPLALAGMRCLIERNPLLVLITEFNPAYLDAKAGADFLDLLAACGFDVGIIDDDRRQLAVGPKAAMLKRLLEEGNAINLLATRDRSLFERLFQQQGGLGKQLGRLEAVRL